MPEQKLSAALGCAIATLTKARKQKQNMRIIEYCILCIALIPTHLVGFQEKVNKKFIKITGIGLEEIQ